LFQVNDVNKRKAKITLTQFIKHYHSVTDAIDAGYGPKANLSPSAWLRSISDLTTRILNGILITRANLPAPPMPHVTNQLFTPADQDTIAQIQSNLDHLAKVFTLSQDSPSLVCIHCLHKTDLNLAQEHLSVLDYETILMATDHSQTSLLDRILAHFSADIYRKAKTWYLDKGTHQWNALWLKIIRESEDFYVAQTTLKRKTLEAKAKVVNKEYYENCLAELKKDLDAQLKHEMATYQVEIQVNQPAGSEATTTNNPEEGTWTNPPAPDGPPLSDTNLKTLFAHLSDQVEQLENKLSMTMPWATQAKETPTEAPKVLYQRAQVSQHETHLQTPKPKVNGPWSLHATDVRVRNRTTETKTAKSPQPMPTLTNSPCKWQPPHIQRSPFYEGKTLRLRGKDDGTCSWSPSRYVQVW
jgi:hypothetical protein